MPDPMVRQLREQISDNDRAIVDAVNKRLKLVAQLCRQGTERCAARRVGHCGGGAAAYHLPP